MFIRRTPSRLLQDGKHCYTHRLVTSERVGAKVRQRTLLNLGAPFALAREQWPLLCTRIEPALEGEQPLLALGGFSDEIDVEAQRIVAQLVAQQPALSRGGTQATPDIQSVEVDSLEWVRPRSVGVEQVGLWAMEQVAFSGLLTQMGLNGPQQAAVIGSIIARMAAPGSEQATYRWLQGHSALGELIDFDYETRGAMALYCASDRLYRHRDTAYGSVPRRFSQVKCSRADPNAEAPMRRNNHCRARGEPPAYD